MKKYLVLSAIMLFCTVLPTFAQEPETEGVDRISTQEEQEAQENTETENQAPSTEGQNSNFLQQLEKHRENVNKIGEKSETDKIVDETQEELLEVQIEKQNLEDINNNIQEEIKAIRDKLEENNTLKQKLSEQSKTSEQSSKKAQDLEAENQQLQRLLSEKESIIIENSQTIAELSNLELLKEYLLKQNTQLKKDLEAKQNKELQEKLQLLYYALGAYILLFLITRYLPKSFRRKYRHHLTVIEILSTILLFGFFVWFFFYVKPDMIIILFFLASAIILIMKDFIVSFLSSLLIVNQYKIGDYVRFEEKEGLITSLSPLNVTIHCTDKHGHLLGESYRIPNALFAHSEIGKIQKEHAEPESLKIVLKEALQKDIHEIIEIIENDILKKHITITSASETTGEQYFYLTNYNFDDDGYPVIEISWRERREKNKAIKKEIIACIQQVKKESTL